MRESWYRLGIEHQRERAAMEKMHNVSPSADDAIAAIESGKAVSYGY